MFSLNVARQKWKNTKWRSNSTILFFGCYSNICSCFSLRHSVQQYELFVTKYPIIFIWYWQTKQLRLFLSQVDNLNILSYQCTSWLRQMLSGPTWNVRIWCWRNYMESQGISRGYNSRSREVDRKILSPEWSNCSLSKWESPWIQTGISMHLANANLVDY